MMLLKIGEIVKNLIPNESVKIIGVKLMGSKYSITFAGLNTQRNSSKILSLAEVEALEIVAEEGIFKFDGNPEEFKLFVEAERINSAYQFDPLFAVNCSIVDPLPHQVEAVYKFLLPLPRIRFLLADDTGAGKTIMTGLLLKELMMRGMVERVLIVTPGGLTRQWQQDEMEIKFNIPFTLVNRSAFSADPNIFHTAQRIVTSIDFISQDDILNVASQTNWDMVVFDECHKLSAYDYGRKQYLSRRYKAAQTLAQQSEHLLLLTATPHRGRTDTFKRLLQLLDEDIFATDDIASTRVQETEKDGINKFFIRRLKEDMSDWDGKPLYKQRFTQTVSYQLSAPEKKLYDAVTTYLSKKKEEAEGNIHVSLALTVMQRRLVSSIFAIKNTLKKRRDTLQSIADAVQKNPELWKQRHKLDEFEASNIDEFEDLEDDEREALELIMTDPKKFRLFTTAKNPAEILAEAKEVEMLYEMANTLYTSGQEEQKFKELQQLLEANGILDKTQKLVLFTEHKDTLLYLEDRLKNGGYGVATIHGGKDVDERRSAQQAFASESTQILLATDAAGEGINLQFCKLLINWDIPWNPNRLEQRMGRIHRYGQKEDVLVLNMVAQNTREGQVLERLLLKLDIIRKGIGDDRVYDVIQDVLEGISMDKVMKAVLNGEKNELTDLIDDDNRMQTLFRDKIAKQRDTLAHSTINFKDARMLKEVSDEKRLIPIYVKLFFEKAFTQLGGTFTLLQPEIYRIDTLPNGFAEILRKQYNRNPDNLFKEFFCFDKKVFLDYQTRQDIGKVHYINPGNVIFDSLVALTRDTYRDAMRKGTVFIDPEAANPYFAFFLKSQIIDERITKQHESIVDELLFLIQQTPEQTDFNYTSPAKFIDLLPPSVFAKTNTPPAPLENEDIITWAYEELTEPQLKEVQQRISNDTEQRKIYLHEAFNKLIRDVQMEISELEQKMIQGDAKALEKITKKQARIKEIDAKKQNRLRLFERMAQLAPKEPEVIGCAFVIPLTKVEYSGHYGMSRDDDAEAIAMQTVMEYEIANHRKPTDVSAQNAGYDIQSIDDQHFKRYIEVKGRSGADGSVMLSENEMHRLTQLGNTAWLYIVTHCKTEPQLFCIQNPAKKLSFVEKTKGVQFFLPMSEWQGKNSH